MSAEVCAGIVTFNPALETLGRVLEAVRPQVGRIVVVDNGSRSETLSWLRNRASEGMLELLALEANLGVAVGQNQAIEWARRNGFEFILILDQDSVPAPGMVDLLVDASQRLEADGKQIGAVGPVPTDPRDQSVASFFRVTRMRTTRLQTIELAAAAPLEVAYLISSGSLMKISRLDQVGGMEEGLIIDGVDLEWCFRAAARGLKVYVVPTAQLAHSLGDRRYAVWFFGRRAILQHSPIRLYYMQRNALLLAKRSYVPCGWKLYSLRLALERLVAFGLLTPPRWANALMLLLGLWHGIIGRAGPYPEV